MGRVDLKVRHFGEHASGARQECLSSGRKDHAVPGSIEQGKTNLTLNVGDGRMQGWVGAAEPQRGGLQRSLRDNGIDRAELGECETIHGSEIYNVGRNFVK